MGRDIVQERQLREMIQEQKRTNQLLEQVLIALKAPDITVQEKSQHTNSMFEAYFGRKPDTHGGAKGAPEEGSQ